MRCRYSRAAFLLLAGLGGLVLPRQVHGQGGSTSWYALNVPSFGGSNDLSPGGFADNQRVRFMWEPSARGFKLELAYEHLVQLWENPPLLGSGSVPGAGIGATPGWLDLTGEIGSGEHWEWIHRLDRLAVSTDLRDEVSVTVGRQTISWANTLFLTPTDPFAPFDPADPFREFRAGVDAVRIQWFPGAFSQVDGVVRAQEAAGETTVTALVRGRRSLGGWDVSGWGGIIHDQWGVALATSGSVKSLAVRSELGLREDPSKGGVVLRGALGVDYFTQWRRKDAYFLAEYQYDGFGGRDPAGYVGVVTSAPYQRGEMQAIGTDTGLVQGSYQVHALVGVDALVMVNLRDGSGLLAPGGSWSVAREGSMRGGVYLPWGASPAPPDEPLRSEYGTAPPSVYLSISWFW